MAPSSCIAACAPSEHGPILLCLLKVLQTTLADFAELLECLVCLACVHPSLKIP